jgi:hypothetical protein
VTIRAATERDLDEVRAGTSGTLAATATLVDQVSSKPLTM